VFARLVIDAGADIVFGHGPHVTRAIDLYEGKFIAYSMGNFCTYRRFNLKGPNGIAPIVKLWVNGEGDFLQGQIFSTHQLGSGGPLVDENQKVLRKIKELTLQDFPDTALEILDDGLITFKINN
jgi:poly-gamma-glutamate capsule biosynthesis protein CapA/YwtB (metallophosphatase superfamily)